MDIDYLIDRLETLVSEGKRLPLSTKVMVEEQDAYSLIDQMRAIIPEEIKAAKRVLNEKNRILKEAEEEAQQIIADGERERDMLVRKESVIAAAERQREVIIGEATQEAFDIRQRAQDMYDEAVQQGQELREGANQYATQVLQELENLLDKHLKVVRNGLQNFVQQAQQYQHQMDDYERKNRRQYAPSKEERAAAPKVPANNAAANPVRKAANGSAQPGTNGTARASSGTASGQRPAAAAAGGGSAPIPLNNHSAAGRARASGTSGTLRPVPKSGSQAADDSEG
jgi:vacuolar-type H+-ATPase subunit H